MSKLHGVHLPHKKHTAGLSAVRMPSPDSVTIPMNLHIGAPAVPTVRVGDTVFVGTLIGRAEGSISAPVHSSISGKVKGIEKLWTANGSETVAVTVESDGLMTPDPAIQPPEVTDYVSFIDAVRASGAVGLGGAGFPTAAKLDVGDIDRIDRIIINGAECEPYITSDTRTMLDDSESVREGIELLKKYLDADDIVIAVEKNKPEAIREMKKLSDGETVFVKELPSLYPQGGEKVLVYSCTGLVVPEGKLPIDVGCIVINVTTLAFIAKYMKTGMPLVEKLVTVDGGAVAKPQNVIAPVGTALSRIFDFCGGFKSEPAKVLYGGPMMGIAVKDLSSPLLKNNNAVLALDEKEARLPETTACIRCGRCVRACPFSLMPLDFARGYALHDYDLLSSRRVNLCMECGCCSYVCPANRPLVENNKLAKAALRQHLAKTEKGEKN